MRTPITAAQPQPQPVINNNVNQNARPNEAAQQNPFLNLINQTGLGNPSTSNATPSTSSLIPPPSGATMPPPFFFPNMPFMAPYTIPPPPMPQNVDQLSLEELRTMEGNEREHVEERLKLLKNIQTMLNASATLMSQYQMVIANLPAIPVQLQTAPEKPEESSSASAPNKDQVKIEDVGSEDQADESCSKITSTSQLSSIKDITALDNSSTASVSSNFLANESSDETNEIRKRRLQKFLPTD